VTHESAPRIGDLDWRPAAEDPELLAEPVLEAVRTLHLDCFVSPIHPDLADTAEFCATYRVSLDISANCVVVAGRRGEQTTMAACLVLATDRADINRVVRKRLDVRKISFAPMSEAVEQTRMAYGGITPIGLPADWPILVDAAVAAQDWLVIGSGIRGSKILIAGADLARLPNAETLALRQAQGT
jgi:prolyl-tRNA editing enzyme YbaK/EbsC (Cys-tRNA(Pro) deacylase)